MRWLVVIMVCFLFSCDKVVEVDLPEYEHELVLEMYLEKGKPLRCLLTESLPYTDTAINKPSHRSKFEIICYPREHRKERNDPRLNRCGKALLVINLAKTYIERIPSTIGVIKTKRKIGSTFFCFKRHDKAQIQPVNRIELVVASFRIYRRDTFKAISNLVLENVPAKGHRDPGS